MHAGLIQASRPTPLAGPAAPSGRAHADFAAVLGIAQRGVATGPSDAAGRARDAAERLVAKVLVEPVLASERASNAQPPPFGPGPGEKQFSGLIDAQRALDLVRSGNWAIVDRLAGDLARASARAAGEPAPDQSRPAAWDLPASVIEPEGPGRGPALVERTPDPFGWGR